MSRREPVAIVTTDGTTVRVDNEHRSMTPDAITQAARSAAAAGMHLWVATTCHAISVNALDRMAEEPLHFDAESLLATALGCYVCEEPWTARATRRRCPGEPR